MRLTGMVLCMAVERVWRRSVLPVVCVAAWPLWMAGAVCFTLLVDGVMRMIAADQWGEQDENMGWSEVERRWEPL